MSRIISGDFYKAVDKKLDSADSKIVKIGIQQMLHRFEQGHSFERYDLILKNGFNSQVHYILQHTEDEDARKWLYHLLCHYEPTDNNVTKDICKSNVHKESEENISWISAVLAAQSKNEKEFAEIINNSEIKSYLSDEQIEISACAYRESPFSVPSKKKINKLVDSEDWLSQIWLTKIYANKINFYSDKYKKYHADVTEDIIEALFYNDNETVRKYSVWAFAQKGSSGFEVLHDRADLSRFDKGQIKWYFNSLFADKEFIQKESDYAKDILEKQIFDFPKNVREGIINGLGRSGYVGEVASSVYNWFESDKEKDDTIRMLLAEYIIKYHNENEEYKEILDSLIRNRDTLPEKLKNITSNYLENERRRNSLMGNYVENNYGINVQGNAKITIKNSNSEISEKLQQDICCIKEKLDNIDSDMFKSGDIDDLKNFLIQELSHNLKEGQNKFDEKIVNKIVELEELINKMDKKSSKMTLGKIIGGLADIISLGSFATDPEVIQFVSDVISKILKFL